MHMYEIKQRRVIKNQNDFEKMKTSSDMVGRKAVKFGVGSCSGF